MLYSKILNLSEYDIVIREVKNTVPWTCGISDLKGEEIVWTFEKELKKKTNQKEFRVQKVVKRNSDKLYVKWKSCNSFLTVGLIKKT